MKLIKNIGLLIFAFSATLILAWTVSALLGTGEVSVREGASVQSRSEDTPYGGGYMIKEYYGNIGVYMKTGEEYALISIVDTDVSLLPEADIAALKEGIYLEEREQMLLLIEDYMS